MFKKGDLVERFRGLSSFSKYHTGTPFTLTECNRWGNWVDPTGHGHIPDNLRLVVGKEEGPVVTIVIPATTVKKIKPGIYDGLTVGTESSGKRAHLYYAGYASKVEINKLIAHLAAVSETLPD